MENLLRVALTINTNYDSFLKNLSILLPYISNIMKGKACDILDYQKYLEDNLKLKFTYNEIEDSIKYAINKGWIEKIGNKYGITKEGKEKIEKNNQTRSFQDIILEYIKKYDLKDKTKTEIFELICGFLYERINSDIVEIGDLLNKNYSIKTDRDEVKYTEQEIRIINGFLEWDNKDKDEMIYRLISFSVDFCRINTKKNLREFKDILKNKVFLLDTNIIYRLMGLNNEDRKLSTKEFISRCIDCGIKLCYTNYTFKELMESIDYHIDILRSTLDNIYADNKHIKKIYEKYGNRDNEFHHFYYEWASKNNQFKNWDGFSTYIKDELNKLLRQFQYININNYREIGNYKTSFDDYVQSLNAFVGEKRYTNKNLIEYDVQNIIYLLDQRGKGTNAYDIKEYLISADGALNKWARKIFQGQSPYVVKPSVWYSIILKLSGRVPDGVDEYKAYLEFIKLRVNTTEAISVEDLLYQISRCSESPEIQEKIIDEVIKISDKRDRGFDEASTQEKSAESIVSIANDNVIQRIREEEFENGRMDKENEYELEKVHIEKENHKQVQLSYMNGRKESIIKQIDSNTTKIYKRNKQIKKNSIIVFIVIIIYLIWQFIKMGSSSEIFNAIFSVPSIFVSIFIAIITAVGQLFLPTDIDKIKLEEKFKFKEELDMIDEEIRKINM